MKNILKSATLLLAVFLSPFLNNTAKAQCPIFIDSVITTPVTCFGGSDGSMLIYISGGNSPFSYVAINVPYIASYTGTESSHLFSGIPAGQYTIVVQSAGNECSATYQDTIFQPSAAVTVAMSFTQPSCNGGTNGTATATPSGGTGPYTYLWSAGGQTTQTATGLAAGTYTVAVTDSVGCVTNGSVTVTQPAGMSQSSVVTNVLCNGQSNGAIDLTVSGGTGPYTYLWSPGGATTEDISGLAPGSYSVVITDANGCTHSPAAIVVSEPAILTTSETHVDVNCAGSSTGSINLSVAGGTAPYTYLWNTGQTTQDLSGLAPGLYSVTVTDDNGCTTNRGVTISQLSNLSLSTIITNPTCGLNNGSVNLTVSGGSGNYTYSWSPGGATTEDISGIGAGIYTVTVVDLTFGCTQVLANNVQNTGTPDLSAVITNATNCNASDGAIDVTVTAGSGNYTYSWSPGGQATQDLAGLVPGNYTISVTDNVSGCVAIATYTVSYNNAMTLTASITSSNCSSNSGAIDLTVTGGTPSFTYLWSNGATTQDLSGIGGGIYSVTVTDGNGCTANSVFPVSGSNGITVTSVQNNVACFGQSNGSIDLTVSGGSGSYTYSWSNGATTQDISSLSPGTYTVSVTDAVTLCSSFLSFTITQPAGYNGFADITHVTCNGGNNGAIDLTLGGATPPYSYLWSNAATTQDISGLTAGTYTVVVTDANGCTAGAGFVITQPAGMNLTETHVNVSCNGGANGSINLSVAGGTAPYTYGWSNGATTQDISGLVAGFYSVTVTDANGCTSNLNITITELSNLTINIVSVVNSQCNANTGAIDITITGGSGNYTYSWSPGGATTQDISNLSPGIYTVTVTDVTLGCVQSLGINVSETGAPNVSGVVTPASNCASNNGAIDITVSGGSGNYSYSWVPGGATTQDISGLAPNAYNVTVTDVTTGCSGVFSFAVTAGNVMTLTGTITNSTCSGSTGAIDLTVSGGTAPFTYLWTNGATTQDISGLAGAIYGVTVTDANGCTANMFFSVSETSGITLSVAITNINCSGGVNGAINLTVSGGSGNFTYLWSNGATTQDLLSIPGGSYSVNVTDVNTGCTSFAIYTVTEPAPISLSTNVTNIPCSGSGTGSIDLTVSGGTPGYTYSWSNGATTQDLSGLAAGTYILTFSDANGCGGVYSFTVNQPTAIIITETHVNVTCNGLNNGSIDISVSGGTAPYSYSWATGGQTTQDLSGLAPGTYTVTVTDANGCTGELPVTITEPAVLSATETHTNVVCFGQNNGTIDVTVSGGTGPYTYAWVSGQTTQDLSGLSAGTYSVTITDANGCTTSINNIVITQPPSVLTAVISNSTPVSCFGLCNGTATVTPNGGNPGYTYLWLPGGQTTQTATGLCSGIYTVTVTDASGCTAQASVTIIQPNDLIASATMTPASCQGICDGTATASQVGGTAPYTYHWLPGNQATITISGQCAGTYQVVVTDFNGCDDTATVVITEPITITTTTSSTPATCNGICNGTATVNPVGGTTPYTYLWTPGNQTTQTAVNLCGGVYNVTVTDANGCSTVATVIVNNATSIVINISSTDPTCNGVCDGTITANASGGTAPYTYSWSPGGQTTNSISNLCAGTYILMVTDANGCQQTATVTLTQPSPIVITPTTTPATCNGTCDGSASISVSGGTPGYTYLWTPGGQTTTSVSGLCAGTYSVLVTDANGCTQTINITVAQPPAITLNTIVTNVSCNGQTNGSIDLSASGGTPGYTYLWSNGQTTQDISNLAPGTYTVTVTDANGCTANTSATVNEPSLITITTNATAATCGQCDATATVTPSGGTAPYTYLWGTGATTATATNLCAGVYPVFVTDANGCVGSFAIPISNLGGPTSANLTTTDASCFGVCDGSATVSPVGGSAPYTYLWVPGGQTTNSVSGLCGGTYNVQISDTNNCILTQPVLISEPTQIVANETVVTADCGLCNGSISLAPSGGQSPYTYLWGGGETTNSLSGLCAGIYTVDITDANGCTESLSIPVNNIPASSIVLSSTDVSCNGVCDGTATATVTLGTAPFTYLWSDGQTTATATGLCAGTYAVQVTDDNGCIATDLITISEPAPVALSLLVVQNSSCSGSCNGSIDVIPSGGTLPYSYSWSPNVSSTYNANGLCAGVYNITVTDANGCFTVISGSITDPTGLTATATGTDVDCNGSCNGTATVTPAGGTPGYSYLWTPSNQTTQTATGLCADTYTVQVTDANGCSYLTTVTINEPSALTTSFVNVIDLSCSGICDGQATVVASGGVPPYTYQWNDLLNTTNDTAVGLCATTYTVIVTDANGCTAQDNITLSAPNGLTLTTAQQNVSCFGLCDASASVSVSGGVPPFTYQWNDLGNTTNDTVTGLCAGTYTVIITDANNCLASAVVTITEPAVLAVTVSTTDVLCNSACDGTATANVTGGTTPYSYLWSDGQTTQTATGLCPGQYYVDVTDVNGCFATDTTDFDITEPTPVVLSTTWTDAQCFGACDGTATVTPSGGTPGYTYLWTPSAQTDSTATGLCPGTYIVAVTDANGCVESISVTIGEPTDIILSTDMQSASCNGVCDASAWVVASGGTPSVISGYTYSWNPTSQTGDTATALCAGIYTVTVTDSLGCVKSTTINVTEPAAITISFATNDVTCFGFCNGDITGTPSGGTAPYTYQWLNTPGMETGNFADSLCPGEYYLLVTDANGCTGQDTAIITEPTLLGFVATVNNNVSCGGLCDGSASATPSGGTPGYTYLWSPSGQTDSTATNLCAGTYTVTVTDANGCDTTQTIIITEPPILTLYPTTTNASCGGVCDGTATAHVGGGTPPYQYAWSDGQTDSTAVNLCAGSYTVLVTDANGCTVTVTVIILEPPVITSAINDFSEILCVGSCDAYATVSVNGGVPPYTYLWSPGGQTDQTADSLCIGNYSVVVTDAIGCNTTASITISDQNALATAIPLVNNVSCFGLCDGNATAIATGGVPPYSFQWDDANNQTTPMAINLCPGTYTVTITDAANCVSTSTIEITEPALLTSSATSTDASCGGTCDGTATVTALGGTQPYAYLWVPGGQTGATATALCAGTYTVTVTDANGCTSESTVTIDEPPVLLASASVTAPACSNTNNGAIALTVSGGVPGYSFDWLNGETTQNIDSIYPGVYTVTITDNTGCSVTLTINVIEQVVIDANAGPDQVICIGEVVQLQASGGSSYLWTPASGLNYDNIDNPVATITTTTTYIVTVSSFNCTDYDTVTITVNPLPVIDAGPGAYILAGTTVQLVATGAGTNGTYSWTPTSGLDNPNIYNPIASPLETTYYYVTGTDENGCSATDSLTVNVSPGIVFPDGITPNDDGKNDTWIIDFINNYPEAVVMVYNRWGQELFYSKGYGTPWDGKYKGKDLPVGTYYYVIDLHEGTLEPYTGPITIAR